MNETRGSQTAREQLGYFRKLRDQVGRMIKGTNDPEKLRELKERAARLRKQEEYWEQQVKQK